MRTKSSLFSLLPPTRQTGRVDAVTTKIRSQFTVAKVGRLGENLQFLLSGEGSTLGLGRHHFGLGVWGSIFVTNTVC